MAGHPAREKKKYLMVFQGKISQRVDAGTPNAVERTNKNGEKVHELIFESFSAEIRDIYVEDSGFGEQCRVLLHDMGEEYILNFPTDGSTFDSFAKKSPNIQPFVYYNIKPFDFKSEDGKRLVGINIFDEDKKVETYFTKENPGDMPVFPQKKSNGDTDKRAIQKWVIDKTAFLVSVITKEGERLRSAKDKAYGKVEEERRTQISDEESDLPF